MPNTEFRDTELTFGGKSVGKVADSMGLPLAPFGLADVQAAQSWGCNCGPAAIAAVAGISLDELRPHLVDFETKRYTNPTLMLDILNNLKEAIGLKYHYEVIPAYRRRYANRMERRCWPRFGLVRIQWEGPWTNSGVPIAARYRKTHWVGSKIVNGFRTVFDINAMVVGGWLGFSEWSESLVPWLCQQCVPGWNGRWHVTHAITVGSPRPEF